MEFVGPQSHVAVVNMHEYVGQVLVDVWPDGRVTLAFRRYNGDTWSPPVQAGAPAAARAQAVEPEDGEDESEALCEHGMSAWLCMGPMHYPSRQDEMEGRYF